MRWVAIFTDGPGMPEVRRDRAPAHFDYLRRNSDKVRISGGLRDVPDGPLVGGLWVIETETREEALALIEADPYWAPECRSFRLLVWGKALGDIAVTL